MEQIPPPAVRLLEGVYLMELGEEYSHLQEPFLEQLSVLRTLADTADPARVVLDLRNVEVIGSAVIGLMVTASKILAARGGSFALANANSFCQAAIRVTRLDELLPLYSSTAEATQQIAPTPL